jgi:hypothetical protein
LDQVCFDSSYFVREKENTHNWNERKP